MKKRNLKKIFAVAMAGVMTLGNGLVVFADAGVTGNGVVEYDNSEAIAYDVINVPTVNAATYNFTLDPTGQLHTFDASNYGTGTVYFSSKGTRASIQGKTGVTLYTKGKTEVAATDDKWGGIVKELDTDGSIKEVNAGFHVWIPDTANATATTGKYTAGLPGKFEELTKDNIGKWFELKGESTNKEIGLKGDYKAGANVCDGKIYKDTYTAVTGNKITDSDTDPLSNYVTITSDAPTAFPNLYTSNTGTAATAGDVEYTKEEMINQGTTDAVTVINKSTKQKTVTATITMNNISGITFNNAAAYASSDDKASMYVAATNGTTTNPLVASADGTKATATYSVDLAAPTISENTYMTTGTNSATGGHNFARYEGYGTTYTSDSFYITASANSNASAKEAWETWAKAVTADTKPNINIVYSVADKVLDAAPSIATRTYTMESGEDVEITLNYGAGSLAATDVDKVTFQLNGETRECSTSNYNVGNGKLTILGTYTSAMISNNVTSRVFTVVFNDTAKTAVTVTLATE